MGRGLAAPSQELHTHFRPFGPRTEQNIQHHWRVRKGHPEYLQCWKHWRLRLCPGPNGGACNAPKTSLLVAPLQEPLPPALCPSGLTTTEQLDSQIPYVKIRLWLCEKSHNIHYTVKRSLSAFSFVPTPLISLCVASNWFCVSLSVLHMSLIFVTLRSVWWDWSLIPPAISSFCVARWHIGRARGTWPDCRGFDSRPWRYLVTRPTQPGHPSVGRLNQWCPVAGELKAGMMRVFGGR